MFRMASVVVAAHAHTAKRREIQWRRQRVTIYAMEWRRPRYARRRRIKQNSEKTGSAAARGAAAGCTGRRRVAPAEQRCWQREPAHMSVLASGGDVPQTLPEGERTRHTA